MKLDEIKGSIEVDNYMGSAKLAINILKSAIYKTVKKEKVYIKGKKRLVPDWDKTIKLRKANRNYANSKLFAATCDVLDWDITKTREAIYKYNPID